MLIKLLLYSVLCLVSVWVLVMVYFFTWYGFPGDWKDEGHESD